MINTVYNGNSIDVLSTLPSDYIQTCVTSPPYWGLRDYGVDGQLGLEKTPQEYVENLVTIFREVRRVLRPDGTLWLNLGDSYSTNGSQSPNSGLAKLADKFAPRANERNANRDDVGSVSRPKRSIPDDLKPKDLVGIPWRVAFALQADGWYLRQDIIWNKPNPMPESVKDRCTKSHEYVFLLTKSPRYYFDHIAIKEPCSESNIKDFLRRKTMDNKGNGKGSYEEARPDLCRDRSAYMPKDFKRNKRSVWTVTTKPFKGAHFATFPPDLIEPCVLAGSKPGDIVLDPFFGSGTVGVVSLKHERKYIGIDINESYCSLAMDRISKVANDNKPGES